MSLRRRGTVATLRASFALLFVLSLMLTWCSMPPSNLRADTSAPTAGARLDATEPTAPITNDVYPDVGLPPDVLLGRVVGNALPPRHHPNRTLANIRFILEHEDLDDARVQTHWVLNRILDPVVEADIVALLTLFQANYSVIPFDVHAYAAQPFALFDEDDGTDHLHADTVLDAWNTKLLVSSIYDTKNLYAMSINHARNAILDLGHALGVRWILPWDQNCFLTRSAWKTIRTDLDSFQDDASTKYVVTWMDRLRVENDIVLAPNYTPDAWEEPQIIFRSDAGERFDEALRYGRRDKAALLVRLGVPGVWFEWGWSQWERARTHEKPALDCPSPPPSSGYVVRLFSGKAMYEGQANGFHREMARADAVTTMLETLEARAMVDALQYTPTRLVLYDVSRLQPLAPLDLAQVRARAERAMQWSNPVEWSISDRSMYSPDMTSDAIEREMRRQFDAFVDATTALVFGYLATRDDVYATKALMLVHAWFIQDSTKMQPVSSLTVTHSLPVLCDALRLLQTQASSLFTTGIAMHVTNWMKEYLSTLVDPEKARSWFVSPGAAGLSYDMQVASLSAYVNDPARARYHLHTAQSRLLALSAGDDAVETLRLFVQLAAMGVSAGVDMWRFEAPTKPNVLCTAVAAHVACCDPNTDHTCTAATTNVSTIYARGWDLLDVALRHCDAWSAACLHVRDRVRATVDNAAHWQDLDVAWLAHSIPPYPALWQ
ncbi:hypothetical protein SPRG_09127 [Saprolegnia parasitica CBS 223.65]|uniref:Alginate lyase domain-containing protein n=1 Tax=Saprolegnia parasitica (strain CBS 223.65) TaxID=695850 RepID=A0A067CER3_SAPPC|nr:hypothetical protein SPRG_09127 [Saprolegnia parasitica CBS 223.65]KDO25297.1 hypothetical protein SPRG_09127 [Saprolegnia parasitica CBS 223.65]|eukprot:XP_012203955.1 hypothetical protein SPRG_09127 [Saprolegnia parasitica CBS 223.65]